MKTSKSSPEHDAVDVNVEILERSDTLLLVRWVEPGRCHCGEQRWRRRFARRAGTCVLSHKVIHCGDEVFRPAERSVPANTEAMISVAEVFGSDNGSVDSRYIRRSDARGGTKNG
ncbi:DUF3331 domain-containing protein [Burkholderia alba]|uniref:DUF3331 domain-containing protein n=1 Tax=Burkholderia alba TaxID=2683677 RepID=UPI002B05EAF0|nr:DUF3331 domain-containing protein [Burkholderia alba]